ncbi:MAG: hypothetical protein O7G84_00965 [Gammaproteobacteria bacterium]|nr:hypothetical protein [Gammaproteobacteria bacterium]
MAAKKKKVTKKKPTPRITRKAPEKTKEELMADSLNEQARIGQEIDALTEQIMDLVDGASADQVRSNALTQATARFCLTSDVTSSRLAQMVTIHLESTAKEMLTNKKGALKKTLAKRRAETKEAKSKKKRRKR